MGFLFRDENYMDEVYKHRIFPRPQLPPGSEIMSSPIRPIASPTLSLESVHNEMELTLHHKVCDLGDIHTSFGPPPLFGGGAVFTEAVWC